MAAGMGSRYGGLKQIDPMGPNGETLMEYSVYDAIRAGFGRVVFIIRKEFADTFRETVGSKFADRIEVAYAFQELDALPAGYLVPEGRVKPWGTGQAILSCKDVVDEPFAVQNADDYYGVEAYKVIADELLAMGAESTDSCMVGFQLKNTLSEYGSVSRGVCETAAGYLTDIVERLKIERNDTGAVQYFEDESPVDMTGEEICSMNFWGFTPKFFQALERRFVSFLEAEGTELKSEWLIPPIIDDMIKAGDTRVKVLSSRDSWFGVTYPADKPRVVESLAAMHDSGKYPMQLWG
jgi:NDP-sugar pyrophosphorylase family protein